MNKLRQYYGKYKRVDNFMPYHNNIDGLDHIDRLKTAYRQNDIKYVVRSNKDKTLLTLFMYYNPK
jgi:hypothetical protein